MENRIVMATEADADAVLRLYREQLGREYCFWTEEYPGPDTIAFDLSRDALFVMKNDRGELIAAISAEEDEDVNRLACWTPSLQPGGEFARPECPFLKVPWMQRDPKPRSSFGSLFVLYRYQSVT